MAVEIIDIPREVVRDFIERKTVVRYGLVDVDKCNYIIVECAVSFDDDFSNRWSDVDEYGNWRVNLLRGYTDTEALKEYTEGFLKGKNCGMVTSVYDKDDYKYAVAYEVWHLVDQEDYNPDEDFDPVVLEGLVSLDEVSETVTALKEINDGIQCFYDFDLGRIFAADFDYTYCVWTIIGSYDPHFVDDVYHWCDWLLKSDGIESIVTPLNHHDNGLYDVGVLLRSKKVFTPRGWYLTLSCIRNDVTWLLNNCDSVYQFMVFSYNSFGGLPVKRYGFPYFHDHKVKALVFIRSNHVERGFSS